MHDIYFLTGNAGKWAIARDVFASYGLSLKQADLDLPEIQSLDVSEVAAAATHAAAARCQGVLIKSDVGYYFEGLNGFPGPLIKWINQTLTAEDLLALMKDKANRRVAIRDCLACRMPSGEVHKFEHIYYAQVGHTARGQGSPVNQILTIDGFDKTLGECSKEELHAFWVANLEAYHDVARFLANA